MQLEHVIARNFRSLREAETAFRPDLTVVVGENNSGKSNLIEAIRLLTFPADGRRTRYCEIDDITRDTDDSTFELSAIIGGLTTEEQALFMTATEGVDSNRISHHLHYESPGVGERRGHTSWTVGANKVPDPEPEARETFRHVYLPPLRDAQRELSSGSTDRLRFLLEVLAADDEVEDLEAKANKAFGELQEHPLINRADDRIRTQLSELTQGTIRQRAELGFVDAELRRLAAALRLRLSDWGLEVQELASSGHGYANLLFLATVIVELQAARDADLTLFLVEEPEAHLHPQLQGAVLDFLKDVSQPRDEGGQIQVIVVTHSAQLTASVPSRHVQVLRTVTTSIEEAGKTQTWRESRSIPVWQLGLSSQQLAKVDRYLDVTRAALLFAPRVVLVEGIAEALLMPVIAKRILSKADLSRFRATSLIAIEGVDFEPYIRLLLTSVDGTRIADKVVVVTDSDPLAPGDRRKALGTVATDLGADKLLQVEVADITFEAALFAEGNDSLLKEGFLAQRPKSEPAWTTSVDGSPPEQRSQAVVDLLRDKRVRKGDLAQHIAGRIEAGAPFEPPDYLQKAIRGAVAVDES